MGLGLGSGQVSRFESKNLDFHSEHNIIVRVYVAEPTGAATGGALGYLFGSRGK